MTDKKAPQNPEFVAALAALITRHQLTEAQAAALLGVPVFTLRKWRTGTRAPNAAAVRLVEVFDLLAVLAPAILAGLIPTPDPVMPKRPRTKVTKTGESK
jgi:hypothetical protein